MKTLFILVLCVSPILTSPKGARIIGGQEAFAGEFPYAAAIYKNTGDGNYFCTGSLLNNDWVITAGQCVDGAILFTILLGTHKLSGDEASVQRLTTDSYVLHPDYNALTLDNDIGLIKFRIPVTLTTYIRQLYLPYADLSAGSAAGQAYGWGQISDDDGELADTLHHVTLVSVSDAECRLTFGNQIGGNIVCFGGNFNQGTCYGDAGSPIIQDISRGYTIVVAVASFFSGNGCESTDPSGYTKVFPYNDWINNIIRS